MQTAYDEPPEDMLPPDVVNFRRSVVDLLWDDHRYASLGTDDRSIGADTFVGRCLSCGGPLVVRFYRDADYQDVALKCANKNCHTAAMLHERLELVAE
jgi:hypothetical protein